MGTFTLSQNQIGKNLYIYPNGDLSTCTEFATVGASPNYACVDEDRLTPDEDTTFVWWNNIAVALDLYSLQNHTTESGTINYVQVYARAKSHDYAQHIDGGYKIICSPDSICSNVYKSLDINLVTSYTTYNKVWTVNPDDDATWEWTDIDSLCIGVECSSPTIGAVSTTLALRPIGDGFWCTLVPVGEINRWECVDDIISDDDATYVYSPGGGWHFDLYHLQNHTTETGLITNVTVFMRCKSVGGTDYIKAIIRTGGSHYDGVSKIASSNYTLYSDSWATNPNTGVAWTWADIDSLYAGVNMNLYTQSPRCTQLYVIVTYLTDISPKIRTTQCYAKVNYDTDVTCNLNKPKLVSTSHSRNIKILNFWNGSREVYDLNRSGKSMVLTGSEMYNSSCSRILCVRNMGRDGSVVSITGLSLGYFNGNYRINQFGWKKISEKPEHYDWILDLEDTEL